LSASQPATSLQGLARQHDADPDGRHGRDDDGEDHDGKLDRADIAHTEGIEEPFVPEAQRHGHTGRQQQGRAETERQGPGPGLLAMGAQDDHGHADPGHDQQGNPKGGGPQHPRVAGSQVLEQRLAPVFDDVRREDRQAHRQCEPGQQHAGAERPCAEPEARREHQKTLGHLRLQMEAGRLLGRCG
jgi:hypothetical protein